MDKSLVIEKLLDTKYTSNLSIGDKILKINGENASDFSMKDREVFSKFDYEILSIENNTTINVSCPVPLAVKALPNTQFLVQQLKNDIEYIEFEYLEILWERNDIDAIHQVIRNIFLSNPLLSLLSKFSKNTLIETPFSLFMGISNFHKNKLEKARKQINYYKDNVMPRYTTNFHALCHLYLAFLTENTFKQEDHFSEANNYNKSRSQKINAFISDQNIELVPLNKIQNQGFPVSFTLNGLEEELHFDLDETLSSMNSEQLLPLCIMPWYRANGPYSEMMTIYTQMFSNFSKQLLPLHIITNVDQGNCRDWWFNGENLAKHYNTPFYLLDDPDMEISDYLEQDISPAIYVLNKHKEVIYQGLLDDPFDYWLIAQ